MATQPQNLSREMAHAYLTGTAPRTNRLSSLTCQPIMTSFMQNKPNFRKAKMKLNFYSTKDYERNDIFAVPENKANSNPIKAKTNPKQTQSKPNQTQFQRQKNAAAFDD